MLIRDWTDDTVGPYEPYEPNEIRETHRSYIRRGSEHLIYDGYYENGSVNIWGGEGFHFLGKSYDVINADQLPESLKGYVKFRIVRTDHNYFDGGYVIIHEAEVLLTFENFR